MKYLELLAPAGNLETLKVAIEAGADAVYIGGKNFGARYFATNFENIDLIEAVNFAHLRGKKVYVTVNTIVYSSEFEDLKKYLEFLYNINVDAIIVQDMGIVNYVRLAYPDFEIHASTQMNINSLEGINVLKKLGIKRVVLARETNIDLIKKLSKTSVEIETFIHGALCFSSSGNCLMSYSIGKRSGNRGKCAQPCRKSYTLFENNLCINKKAALLSMKDLCTIDNIGSLIDAGITSFKIEGRMKSPEYVYVVVKNYRKAIDKYLNKESFDTNFAKKEMSTVFSRGYTDGYILKSNNSDLTNIYSVNHQGVTIGKIVKILPKSFEIKLYDELHTGDAIRIKSNDDIGFVVQIMFKNNEKCLVGYKDDSVKIPISININNLNKEILLTKSKTIQNELKQYLEEEHVKIPINAKFIIRLNERASLMLDDGINNVIVYSDPLINKINVPKDDSFYKEKLNKIVDSVYYFNSIVIENDYLAFISVKEINELRRTAIELLNKKRIESFKRDYNSFEILKQDFSKEQPTFEAIVHTKEQYDICKEFGIKIVYTDYDSQINNYDRLEPAVSNNGLIHNIGHINIGTTISPYFNIVNEYAIDLYKNLGINKIYLSYEMPLEDIKKLALNNVHANVGMPIYGKMDVMVTKHCMIAKCKDFKNKNCKSCINNDYYLEDEYFNRFDIITNPSKNCTLRILDYKIFDIIDNVEKLENDGINLFLITFTTETSVEVRKILTKIIKNKR